MTQLQPPTVAPLIYLEDVPEDAPLFDFELIARALSRPLRQRGHGAVVLGIHGAWGAGKTTLLHALRRQLKSEVGVAPDVFVEFTAWKYQEREALWRALILQMVTMLRSNGGDPAKLEELEQSLYRAFAVEEKGPWHVNWRALIVELANIALKVLQLDFVATTLKGSTGWLGSLLFRGW